MEFAHDQVVFFGVVVVRVPVDLFGDRSLGPALGISHIPGAAEGMREKLLQQIKEFEEKLHPTEEVGASLVNAPGDLVFHITGIGFWGLDLLIFHGVNPSGKPVELLQHVSQVNVLLTALPAQGLTGRRIGFQLGPDAT